jgi:hypothetical protein
MAHPPVTEETTHPPSMASSKTVSARSLKMASAQAASNRSTRRKLRLRHKKTSSPFGGSYGRAKKTLIKDLRTEEERILADRYDLNRDGALDEAEMAMMNYDVDGDGNLTLVEIHTIIEDLLHERGYITTMRKIITGLTCFVLILSLSNLGTSIASAVLVKETTADKTTADMKIIGTSEVMGTQLSAETFQAHQMDPERRRTRRNLVIESLAANPFDQTHRYLQKPKCGKKGNKCNTDIKFDVNFMEQKEVERIKEKCEQGRLVTVAREFPGGFMNKKSLCRTGTTITVKK